MSPYTNKLPGEAFIEITDLSKSYGQEKALHKVSLTVRRAETLVIMGPSGSGKSTLLRCLCGLEEVDSGVIAIGGQRVTDSPKIRQQMRPELGLVFQSFNLFPHLTVLDNLTLAPQRVRGLSKKEAEERAYELLLKVGLSDKAKAKPAQLSGGQQQRVAIARALAMTPQIMLFDEPTSALDPEMIGEVLTVMGDLAREGATMMVVTHETGFAREAGDEIIFMDEGEIVEKGATEGFFNNPQTERAQNFLNKILK